MAGRATPRHSHRGEGAASGRHQMAQHVLQDAAVPEVIQLIERIDAADQRDAPQPAVGGDDLRDQPLVRLELALQPANPYLLPPPQFHPTPHPAPPPTPPPP